jgi:hypothetical protein
MAELQRNHTGIYGFLTGIDDHYRFGLAPKVR